MAPTVLSGHPTYARSAAHRSSPRHIARGCRASSPSRARSAAPGGIGPRSRGRRNGAVVVLPTAFAPTVVVAAPCPLPLLRVALVHDPGDRGENLVGELPAVRLGYGRSCDADDDLVGVRLLQA